MPKRRVPPATPRSSKKKNKKVPETADEFLDVGIELEESGDRWRPGDKLKAGRFYQKAIDSYAAALNLTPASFDAAYNLARLQYQLAQHPELLGSTHRAARPLLETALASHRRCLLLDPANEDALFNTGQVLCSAAEALTEYRTAPAAAKTAAEHLLLEAVEALQQCLRIQETHYHAATPQPPTPAADDDADTPMREEAAEAAAAAAEEEEEEWAHVRAPTTADHILDTTLALLHAHTLLLPLTATATAAEAAAAAETLVQALPPLLAHAPARAPEAALARAAHQAARAEALYRAAPTAPGAASTWEAALRGAFAPCDGSEDAGALCGRADAYIALGGAVSDADGAVAWRAYAVAAASLGAAAAAEPGRAEIWVARGDVEMLRGWVAAGVARASRALLWRNAGVFYRRAGGVEGGVKAAMVRWEEGDGGVEWGRVRGGSGVREVVVEAVEEGVVGGEWLARVGAEGEAGAGMEAGMEAEVGV